MITLLRWKNLENRRSGRSSVAPKSRRTQEKMQSGSASFKNPSRGLPTQDTEYTYPQLKITYEEMMA